MRTGARTWWLFLVLGLAAVATASRVWAADCWSFDRKLATVGGGANGIVAPAGLASDGHGRIYVADGGSNVVRILDRDGNQLGQLGAPGTGPGQFQQPVDVAVDWFGAVYVLDAGNHRVQKFYSNGDFAFSWGSQGIGQGQVLNPVSIASDGASFIYVADRSTSRITKFDSSGNFLLQWGSSGSGNGQFSYVGGVAADAGGSVYVGDTSRVQKFSSSGNFLLAWTSPPGDPFSLGQMVDVSVDRSGNVVVLDAQNNHVEKYTPNGSLIGNGSAIVGLMRGALQTPLAVDAADGAHVYISDAVTGVQARTCEGMEDPGFEHLNQDGVTPFGWTANAYVLNRTTFAAAPFPSTYAGLYSAKISQALPNDASWTQIVSVTPGAQYRFCGWVKTQDVAHSAEGSDVGANLSILGGFEVSPGLTGTNDWTRLCLDFNAGARTQVTLAARLGFFSGTTSGTAWFDELHLERLSIGAPPCAKVEASGLSLAIPDFDNVSTALNVPLAGNVTAVRLTDLSGLHGNVGDLEIHLIGPTGIDVPVMNRVCGSSTNFHLGLSDTSGSAIPCPPTDGSEHLPANPLLSFAASPAGGTWTLRIFDRHRAQVGTLQSWGLEVCSDHVAMPTSTPTFTLTSTTTWTATQTQTATPTPSVTKTVTLTPTIGSPTATATANPCVGATSASTAFVSQVDSRDATDGAAPTPPCGSQQRFKPVWYRFTAPADGVVHVETFGSDYDTLLSTYTGTCAALTPLAAGCSDDATGSQQSEITVPVSAGETYRFLVTAAHDLGGALVFHLEFSPAAAPTPCRLRWQDNGPHINNIDALAAAPSLPTTMYAANYVTLYKTTDAGGTWSDLSEAITEGVSGSSFLFDAIAVHPGMPSTVYAGGQGGIVKSTDAGVTWTVVSSDIQAQIDPHLPIIVSLVIDPYSPTTVYAADTNYGIFKSINGGSNWSAINTGLTPSTARAIFNLAIDPNQPNRLYAATRFDGVFKSVDGGANWAAINSGLVKTLSTVSVDPQSSNTIWTGQYNGVYRSTDSGGTWNKMLSNAGLNLTPDAVAVDPLTPSTIYAGSDRALFRSTDSGGSWSDITGAVTGLGHHYASNLSLVPVGHEIYAGTLDGVFHSTDLGAHWTQQGVGMATGVGGLVVDPLTPGSLYAGVLYGGVGIAHSSDFGASWKKVSGNSITSSVYALAVAPTSPATLWALLTSVLRKSTDSGVTWQTLPQGAPTDVSALLVDPFDAKTIYVGINSGGVRVTHDSGATWSDDGGGIVTAAVAALAAEPAMGAVYAATLSGVYRREPGMSWIAVNNGLTTPTNIAALATSISPSTAYAGAISDGVFRTTNGGISWVAINGGLSDRRVMGLQTDPSASAIVYAATPSGVFRSTDRGASWALTNTGIEPQPAALAVDPTNGTVYAATSKAVSVLSVEACAAATPTRTATTTATSTQSATTAPTLTPTYSFTAVPTATITPAASATATPTVTRTQTNSPSPTVTRTATNTSSVTSTSVPTATLTPMPTATATSTTVSTYTPTADPTSSPSPTATRTATETLVPTSTVTSMPSPTVSATVSPTSTSSPRPTLTVTATLEPTGTPTPTATVGYAPWVKLQVDDFLSFLRVQVARANPEIVYVNGPSLYRSADGGAAWLRRPSPENGGYPLTGPAIDPSNADHLYATQNGHLYESQDAGLSWSPLNPPLSNGVSFDGVFADPVRPAVLYVGYVGGLFRSRDRGAYWESIANPPGGGGVRLVSSLAVAPSRPTTIYAGIFGGAVDKSIDDLATTQRVVLSALDDPLVRVAVDPLDSETAYAVVTPGGVFKTDHGAAWVARNEGLPDAKVADLAIDPCHPTELWAGTANGVFRSTDAGSTWASAGLAHRQVGSLAIADGKARRIYATAALCSGEGDCQSEDLFALPLAACAIGDCDGSGMTGVSDLLTGLAIALGARPLTDCTVFDANGDAQVTIEDLVQAVGTE